MAEEESGGNAHSAAQRGQTGSVSSELVREVAEKVYKLWQQDIAIMRERRRERPGRRR